MKKIYQYSEKKFLSFSEQKQVSIIQEMLAVLEKSFAQKEDVSALQDSILACLTFLQNKDLNLVEDWQSYDLKKLSDIIRFRDKIVVKTGIYLRDKDIVIKRYDSIKENLLKFPLVIILDNLRSAFNVGSIIRSSECLGVSEIALCGSTPDLTNRKVVETAMGTAEYVKIVKYSSVEEAIISYREQGFALIALELTTNSLSLEKYQPAAKVALLLGNESLGIAEETLAFCDKVLEIKMYGIKNSLNVSNATAIAIHSIIQKMEIKNDK